jgi:hypothetical protein
LTRTSTACGIVRAAPLDDRGETLELDRESITIEPTPTSTARSSSATDLLLPCRPRRTGRRPRRARRRASAGGDVDGEALLGHPAHDLGREERLAGVVDACAHAARAAAAVEGVTHRARARGTVLVEDVQRSAELRAQGTPTPAISSSPSRHARPRRPHQRGERVRVGRHGEPRGTSGRSEAADTRNQSWVGRRDVTPGSPRSLGHRAYRPAHVTRRWESPSAAGALLLQRRIDGDPRIDGDVGDHLRAVHAHGGEREPGRQVLRTQTSQSRTTVRATAPNWSTSTSADTSAPRRSVSGVSTRSPPDASA